MRGEHDHSVVFRLRGYRLLIAGSLAATAALFGAPLADACGTAGYSYAGVAASSHAFGIRATITSLPGFDVRSGHVAGWVGVGGPRQGPNGADEWLQVGISGFPETSGNNLYYELALPGRQPMYHQLASNLPIGEPTRLAVLEIRMRPNMWRIWVNGTAASQPIYLPGSHGLLSPIATAESWDGGTASSCNGFLYRFHHVSIARVPGGGWQQLAGGDAIRSRPARLLRNARQGSFLAAQGVLALRALAASTP
jgi:hypothetical protein